VQKFFEVDVKLIRIGKKLGAVVSFSELKREKGLIEVVEEGKQRGDEGVSFEISMIYSERFSNLRWEGKFNEINNFVLGWIWGNRSV